MKTKITYLTIIASSLMAITNVNAQTLRIKGGMNLSNMLIEDNDLEYSKDFKSRVGYQLGLTVQTPNENTFTFEGGVNFSTRGYTYTENMTIEGFNVKYEEIMRLSYINVPLTAKATFELGKAKVYGKLGPYASMGLKGEVWSKASANGISEEDTYEIIWGTDSDGDDLTRFDGGLHGGVGVEYKNLELGVEYDYGIANISAYTDNGTKINNRNIGITLAYKILGGL